MNIWIKKKFIHLRKVFGNQCQFPNYHETENLEFAHLYETKLSGEGRGRKERYYDIINNIDKYMLLCKEHNKLLDEYIKTNEEKFSEFIMTVPVIKRERLDERFE
jgi:hypothetical protein